MKKLVALLATLVLTTAGLVAVSASAANAAPRSSCVKSTYSITVGPYYEDDSYYVTRGGGFTIPAVSCDAPYVGEAQACATFRMVRMTPSKAFGPWTIACWTPQKLASNFSGLFHYGDGALIEYLMYSSPKSYQTIHLWL